MFAGGGGGGLSIPYQLHLLGQVAHAPEIPISITLTQFEKVFCFRSRYQSSYCIG